MKFWLCIDDTDDATKSVGTGEIAKHIFQELKKQGCRMKYNVTRHQLLLNPVVPYTSHNSAMCMEGEGSLSKDLIWNVALEILNQKRSQISNPGICMYIPQKESDEKRLISFGKRAKKEVLTISQAKTIAAEIKGIRLFAPAGNGDGQIGALAGIGLRLSGNDGTFHGKIKLKNEKTVYSVDEIKKALNVSQVYDEAGGKLNGKEIVRVKKQIKLIYRDFRRAVVAFRQKDGIYDLCPVAFVYEQHAALHPFYQENCSLFAWDNDSGEQWSERAGMCENCLHRRHTENGMICTVSKTGAYMEKMSGGV